MRVGRSGWVPSNLPSRIALRFMQATGLRPCQAKGVNLICQTLALAGILRHNCPKKPVNARVS